MTGQYGDNEQNNGTTETTMLNNTLRKRMPRKGENNHPGVVAARIGYLEALAGKPLDCDRYTTPVEQGNYEIGRLWALNLKAAAIKPPTWRAGAGLTRTLQAALRQSFEMIGGCRPGEGDGRPED